VHIPDGFINAATSLSAGAVAAGGLTVAADKSSKVMEEKLFPLAGLTAAFIFAAQMINFPIAAGTSGHLIGGALAAILVGPHAAALCLAVVLSVQALFADGGLTALGLNILNMGFVGVYGGWAVFVLVRRLLPVSRAGIVAGSFAAGLVSVVLASIAFFVEYLLGGTTAVPLDAVFKAMVAVHILVGFGEGLITAATVGTVLSSRPDLVYGARDIAQTHMGTDHAAASRS
jgi:cobalt/nickel transport system permease protein